MRGIARLGVAMTAASLLGGRVVPSGAQVYALKVQQNYADVALNCRAGDQDACAVLPFEAKAVAQAQDDAWP